MSKLAGIYLLLFLKSINIILPTKPKGINMKMQNLAQIYNMNMTCNYNITSFDKEYIDKTTQARYTLDTSYESKFIFIDTELSTSFRFEEKIEDKFYIIELPMIKYNSEALILVLRVTVLEDNLYKSYVVNISDREEYRNIKTKTVKAVLEYSLNLFTPRVRMISKYINDGVSGTVNLHIYNEEFILNKFVV